MIYRILAAIATLVVLLALAGCGGGGTADDPNAPPAGGKGEIPDAEKRKAPSGPGLDKGAE